MMRKLSYILVVVLAFAGGICGSFYWNAFHSFAKQAPTISATKETVYARVMRTQTIRCGYNIWAPIIIKDANSGQLSGIVYDYVEALGKALNLKIEWAQEIGWGDFPVALENGRIDGFCAGVWPNSSRARQIDFVQPILFDPIYAYVRTDDHRFDNRLESINDPAITIATMDGEMSGIIANSDFPKAHQVQLAQLSSGSELFTNVLTGKADVTFTAPGDMAAYDAENPGKLRRVEASTPICVFGNTIAIAHGQDEFRRMLDTATSELLASGVIEKILAKYEKTPGTYLRVASPYQTSIPVSSPLR